ncbi:hypothetical protein HJFPF1_08344 [Paramyrothecium foliicola]|nr:hypothetical protein HJFPF1_08344 [Paramyrothecium foliicola]
MGYFCYGIGSTYLLAYTFHVATSIHGFWTGRRRSERIYILTSKILPLPLTGITLGLQYVPEIQKNWTLYMVVANLQGVVTFALSIVTTAAILKKYISSNNFWNKNSNCSATQVLSSQSQNSTATLDKWLVLRLSAAIILFSGFILSTTLTHLGTPAEFARVAKSEGPNLSSAYARSNIRGYLYGVTPGIGVPLIFGLTRPFRETLYKTFTPKSWQEKPQNGVKEGKKSVVVIHESDPLPVTSIDLTDDDEPWQTSITENPFTKVAKDRSQWMKMDSVAERV